MLATLSFQVNSNSSIVQGYWDFSLLFWAVTVKGACPVPLKVEFLACLLITDIQHAYCSNAEFKSLDFSLKYLFIFNV